MLYTYLRDLGGVLFSIASLLFVALLTVRAFLLKDRPSNLHIAMHFGRQVDGRSRLKCPTMTRMVLPEIFDYIRATWLLLRARAWARRSHFAPVLAIPRNGYSGWRKVLGLLAPSPEAFVEPVRRFLSEKADVVWIERATVAATNPDAEAEETEFVIALVHEDSSPTLRAIVVARIFLECIARNPDHIDSLPHPNYAGATARPETLRKLAAAYLEWKAAPTTSELAITLVEL